MKTKDFHPILFILAFALALVIAYMKWSIKESRLPAQVNAQQSFFQKSYIEKQGSSWVFNFPKEGFVCPSDANIKIQLKALEVASFSSQAQQGDVGLMVQAPCSLKDRMEIYFSSYCGGEEEDSWTKNQIGFSFINYPGFFPRKWLVESVEVLKAREVLESYSINKESLLLEAFQISCD